MAVLTLDRVHDDASTSTTSEDWRARWSVAALSAGAAAIHLALAPGHLGESAILGGGFLVAAWIQLAIAVFAVTRPTKVLWLGTIAANVAMVGTWAVSRTAGLPLSGHAGEVESMNIVDLTTVALEIATVLVVVALLAVRPTGRILFPIVSVLAVAAASTAIASPEARSHGAGGADHHGAAVSTPEHERLIDLGFGEFMNGHAHTQMEVVLDPASQAALDAQLAVTATVADDFPTVQDALDAGYVPAGPYVPGLGYHLINFSGPEYLNPDGVMTEEELAHPLGLMYAGAEPTSELGGFMYYAATDVEPTGFVGRGDGWHFHENLCMVMDANGKVTFPFGPDFGATKAQCDSVSGNLMDSQWMVHVWTVPGWDDMTDHGGVFAEMHPRFACSDGTFHMVEFEDWGDWNNVCVTREAGEPDVDL